VTFYASLDGLPEFTDYAFKSGGKAAPIGTSQASRCGIWVRAELLSFKYGPVTVSADTLKAGDPITATVSVTNTGNVGGDEVVEAYLKTPQKDGPIHSLVGFQRLKSARRNP